MHSETYTSRSSAFRRLRHNDEKVDSLVARPGLSTSSLLRNGNGDSRRVPAGVVDVIAADVALRQKQGPVRGEPFGCTHPACDVSVARDNEVMDPIYPLAFLAVPLASALLWPSRSLLVGAFGAWFVYVLASTINGTSLAELVFLAMFILVPIETALAVGIAVRRAAPSRRQLTI